MRYGVFNSVILFMVLTVLGCAHPPKESTMVDVPAPETIEQLPSPPHEDTGDEHQETITVDEGLERWKNIVTLFDTAMANTEDHPEDALRFYSKVTELAPELWEPYYNMAIIHMRLGQMEMAEEALHMALKRGGSPAWIYNALGIVYMATGRDEKAEAVLKKGLGYERSLPILTNLAGIYIRHGDTDRAGRYLLESERIDPSNETVRYNKGLLLYKRGDYRGARLELETLDEYTDRVLTYRAQALLKLGEYEKALELFEEIAKRDPSNPYPYRNMGIIYEIYMGDLEKALENYLAYVERGGERDEEVRGWIEVVKARLRLREARR